MDPMGFERPKKSLHKHLQLCRLFIRLYAHFVFRMKDMKKQHRKVKTSARFFQVALLGVLFVTFSGVNRDLHWGYQFRSRTEEAEASKIPCFWCNFSPWMIPEATDQQGIGREGQNRRIRKGIWLRGHRGLSQERFQDETKQNLGDGWPPRVTKTQPCHGGFLEPGFFWLGLVNPFFF